MVGRPSTSPPHTVTTDASMEGWGGHAQGSELHSALFHGLWEPEKEVAPCQCFIAPGCWADATQHEQILLGQVI